MFASELIPVTIFIILLYSVPDTPRSLVQLNKEDIALQVLQKVNGENQAVEILNDIKERTFPKTWLEIIRY